MTPNQFRKLALALPDTAEGSHQGHADFRVGGKIFATLGPDETWGMVKLAPEVQESMVKHASGAFTVVPGAWGKQGATRVELALADTASVKQGLLAAWQFIAPKGA